MQVVKQFLLQVKNVKVVFEILPSHQWDAGGSEEDEHKTSERSRFEGIIYNIFYDRMCELAKLLAFLRSAETWRLSRCLASRALRQKGEVNLHLCATHVAPFMRSPIWSRQPPSPHFYGANVYHLRGFLRQAYW